MAIDWKGMQNSVLKAEIQAGISERDERVKDLLEATTAKPGRKSNGLKSLEAPQGDLDREAAGDA